MHAKYTVQEKVLFAIAFQSQQTRLLRGLSSVTAGCRSPYQIQIQMSQMQKGKPFQH